MNALAAGGKPQSHANILQRGWYPALKRAGVYDWKARTGKHVRKAVVDGGLHWIGHGERYAHEKHTAGVGWMFF
jgi:hypothetical protein